MTPKTSIQVLHELIQIHHDRAMLYHDAISTLVRPDRLDLKVIFGELIKESLECQQELKDNLAQFNGKSSSSDTEYKGTVYQVWQQAKSPIHGNNSKAILETCERESEALRLSYETALSSDNSMDEILRLRLNMQMTNIRDAEDRIREYHDAL